MNEKCKVQLANIISLRPNNWYINQAKLDKVRSAWQSGNHSKLPPVLVTKIDNELIQIDGHARTYAAFERGEKQIEAYLIDLEFIEGSKALYKHIHRKGPKLGIKTISDLKDRIVEPEEHKKLWIGYCNRWLKENENEAC